MDGNMGARGNSGFSEFEFGQERQWARLYYEYTPGLRHYIEGYVQCPHEVEDLVQDVFAAAMSQGSPPRNPRAYLFRIAKHQLLAHKRRKRQEMMGEIIVSAYIDVRIVNETTQGRCAREPPEQVLMNERAEIIAALIDRLPPASKEALCLRILDGLSAEEAAQEARCSRQTLKKRLLRARQSLWRSLRRLGL